MKLVRHLTLALSAVSLVASPVVATAADVSPSALSREATPVDDREALGGGLLGGGTFILPLIALIALALALTVSSDDEPVSP